MKPSHILVYPSVAHKPPDRSFPKPLITLRRTTPLVEVADVLSEGNSEADWAAWDRAEEEAVHA